MWGTSEGWLPNDNINEDNPDCLFLISARVLNAGPQRLSHFLPNWGVYRTHMPPECNHFLKALPNPSPWFILQPNPCHIFNQRAETVVWVLLLLGVFRDRKKKAPYSKSKLPNSDQNMSWKYITGFFIQKTNMWNFSKLSPPSRVSSNAGRPMKPTHVSRVGDFPHSPLFFPLLLRCHLSLQNLQRPDWIMHAEDCQAI